MKQVTYDEYDAHLDRMREIAPLRVKETEYEFVTWRYYFLGHNVIAKSRFDEVSDTEYYINA